MRHVVPDCVHTIDQTPLRQFTLDDSIWFPVVDVCRLIETTRSATQMVRTLPSEMICRVRMTDRPPTHMVSARGVLHLVDRSTRAEDPATRAGQFKAWCYENINDIDHAAEKLIRQIATLRGEIEVKSSRLREDAEHLTRLVKELNTVRPSRAQT